MASLKRGDTVIVTKLDRSARELLDLIHRIDQTGAAFRSIGDPLFDTSTSQSRLLRKPKLTDHQRREAIAGRGRRHWPRSLDRTRFPRHD
jgi:DNA invertase Pin-like site-specific DNA recombinase